MGVVFLILVLAIIYAYSGQLGLYLQGETRGITTLWPPTGVAVFFVYKFGYRVWPGIALGMFSVAYLLGTSVPYPPWMILLLSASSIFEATAIVYCLKRFQFSPFFTETKDLYHLYFWGVLLIPCVNALFGSSLFFINGYIQTADWTFTFFGWWLGNSMGLLMLVPMALTWSSYPVKFYHHRKQKLTELFIISCVAIYILLIEDYFGKDNNLQLFFSFVFIIFCSIRYTHHGATIISFILSTSILLQNRSYNGAAQDLGQVIEQEVFIALIYMTGLYIATVLKTHLEAKRGYFREKVYAETILNSIYDAVIVTDSKGLILSLNPSAENYLGQPESQLIGAPISDSLKILSVSTQEDLTPILLDSIGSNKQKIPEKNLVLSANGEELNIELYLSPINIEHQQQEFVKTYNQYKLKGCALTIRDVSHSHKLKEQLNYQASHDHLTGLINRRYFEQRLISIVQSQNRDQLEHVLLFIDLDRFKVINDTSGHVAGDQILRSAASILQNTLRKNDLLARLGGDEFGVLLTNCDLDKGLEIANNLREAIDSHSFKWGDTHFNLSASIGLTKLDATTKSMEAVMREVDIACYEAKDAGKNTVFTYQGSANSKRETDMLWLSRIIKAIDQQQFELFVQPIVSCQTLKLHHYEVLLRLKLEKNEIISPAIFIPAAERHGAMPKVDRWVIEQSIDWLNKHSSKKIKFAINLSGASLGDESFCHYLTDKIASSQSAAKQLCFEITETSAIRNYEAAQFFMKSARHHGVTFALDDFGSGLSSFAYLKSFPIDYLKIDGSIVKEMAENPVDCAMVKSIHEIGKVMGLKTIAEFVENEAIINRCQALKVDLLQGYAIEKPKPLSEI